MSSLGVLDPERVAPEIERLAEAVDVLGDPQLLDPGGRGGSQVALDVLGGEVALERGPLLVRAQVQVVVGQHGSEHRLRTEWAVSSCSSLLAFAAGTAWRCWSGRGTSASPSASARSVSRRCSSTCCCATSRARPAAARRRAGRAASSPSGSARRPGGSGRSPVPLDQHRLVRRLLRPLRGRESLAQRLRPEHLRRLRRPESRPILGALDLRPGSFCCHPTKRNRRTRA